MSLQKEKIKEIELQKAIQLYLSDPSKIFVLDNGKKIQVLSPGRLNTSEGPDFLEVAILIDSKVIIGDAEFHFAASKWNEHNHNDDSRYKSVILHIVFEKDIDLPNPFYTLILPEKKINSIYSDKIKNLKNKKEIDYFSLEELQNYSLIRLIRHITEAKKLVNKMELNQALFEFTKDFLDRFYSKKRRPYYKEEQYNSILEAITKSAAYKFIFDIKNNVEFSIPDSFIQLMKTKIADEGNALRREILLNVILPLAITQANEEARLMLFSWYWSTPSLSTYGVLSRKFPKLPQNFLWQQQGMLEFMREIEGKSSIISDALQEYGIGNLLSFIQWGNLSNN